MKYETDTTHGYTIVLPDGHEDERAQRAPYKTQDAPVYTIYIHHNLKIRNQPVRTIHHYIPLEWRKRGLHFSVISRVIIRELIVLELLECTSHLKFVMRWRETRETIPVERADTGAPE